MKIKVNDMSCKHCVAKIEKELIMNGVQSKISLEEKTVDIKDKDQDKAMGAIKAAGYTPTV
ncbi:heavy-metal-associated domain-containing protein [Acholeplasma hippikon]|uniref:Copper chaperone n=1 Tax=Acholeplasma hippikon TaxID=264636 RepID=A0A449BKD7_9MOLU|nr:cation transporter [Acholeplasma hippikon]VEU82935.1 Copper chaperone [Acholeplasma hippikon]